MAQVGLLEDNARIAKLCATMLHYAGHHVVIYEHPRACLDALLPVHENITTAYVLPIDVLILDLHLPDIPGVDVLTRLRAHPDTRDLPLVFCTAATSSELACAFRLAPQASFIEKPFTYQDLILTITTIIKEQVL